MKIRNLILSLTATVALPAAAQMFNFSLRTNNQQLIDRALAGAFVRVNQGYDLCDTLSNQHFGRGGEDFFSIIPFVGVETERGLMVPAGALTPWTTDADFIEYQGQYRPLMTESKSLPLNISAPERVNPLAGRNLTGLTALIADSIRENSGLGIDTVPGQKNGWLIWLSSDFPLAETDSVSLTSISKEIDVPADGSPLPISNPEISETVHGGIFITPVQTAIGHLAFTLTGIMVLDDTGSWVLDFPFIQKPKEVKTLTPISGLPDRGKFNPLKKKKK